MNKFKLRFKTLTEFESEFGSMRSWRIKRNYHFVDNMNYLLGQEIDVEYYKQYIDINGNFIMKDKENHIIGIPNSYGTWKVYLYQIKVVIVGVDYNEKRVLVYD